MIVKKQADYLALVQSKWTEWGSHGSRLSTIRVEWKAFGGKISKMEG